MSSATTTVGAGTSEHFMAQVIFPVGAAAGPGHNPPEFVNNTRKIKDGLAAGEMHNSGGGVGGGNSKPGTSDGGGINICDGRVSTSSSGLSGVESMTSQQMIASSACQPSTSTSAAVVLRETRSSSPSVWRRGLLVTDRGKEILILSLSICVCVFQNPLTKLRVGGSTWYWMKVPHPLMRPYVRLIGHVNSL